MAEVNGVDQLREELLTEKDRNSVLRRYMFICMVINVLLVTTLSYGGYVLFNMQNTIERGGDERRTFYCAVETEFDLPGYSCTEQ